MEHRSLSVLSCDLVFFISVLCTVINNVTAVPCNFATSKDGFKAECDHCRLTKFPGDYPAAVTRLDISFNFLTSLVGLADPRFIGLRQLDVSHNSLTSLPDDAFRDTPHLQELSLEGNALCSLSGDVFRGLHNLTQLTLSHTKLTQLSHVTLSHVTQLTYLDLSNNQLDPVPTEALCQTPWLQVLNLGTNALRTVGDNVFMPLLNLQHLTLNRNKLSVIHQTAFNGLRKLQVLDLSGNSLALDNSTYPPGVFRPLVALEELYLAGNDDSAEGDYPLNVFTPLPSLRVLSIDTFSDAYFGAAFTSLTRLTSLTLASFDSRGCGLRRLTNQTLHAFGHSGLRTVVIRDCPVLDVEVCAFCDLPKLSSLTVNLGEHILHLPSLLLALYGLQNQTMDLVDFSDNRCLDLPNILDMTNTKYLYNTCIKQLDLSNNDIAGMSSRGLRMDSPWLKCLRHIDVSYNKLSSCDKSVFMKLLFGATNMEIIEAQNQRAFTVGDNDRRPGDASKQSDITLKINTAKSLRVFNLKAAVQELSQLPKGINFTEGGNISTLNLAYDGAFYCDSTITGLTAIKDFDFSGNNCHVLGTGLFQHMTTLRRLNISNVHVTQDFLLANGSELLRPLGHLEVLDLSDNDLMDLPDDLLRHQLRLSWLGLAWNRFQTVPVDVSMQTSLSNLDLSHNNIPSLDSDVRQTLDNLAANHTVTLRLRGNPLTCTCQSLDMVSWLATTVVRLDGDNHNMAYDDDYDDNGRDYPCVLEDGGMGSTGSVMAQWEAHWRRCVGLAFLTVSAVALLVQVLGLLLTYLLWSKWTYVRHAWYVLRHLRLPRRHDFENDAVFVYADCDLELAFKIRKAVGLARPGLRLSLLADDIMPGSFLADGIASSMERSWKVVLLVTQTFLQDDWSGYSVLQAQGSISDTLPDRVLVLMVGPLQPWTAREPSHLSMRTLLRMIPESCVYHVPGAFTPRHNIWTTLGDRIARDPI
ncbi:toll-like receptor 3 [Littorina saxatilis]|uniref:TIR domain-containing protein n=1 Tax=Littorina saxatilis TaxID=31220 RepID=A0AAN9BAP5_9CAEN